MFKSIKEWKEFVHEKAQFELSDHYPVYGYFNFGPKKKLSTRSKPVKRLKPNIRKRRATKPIKRKTGRAK